MSQKPKTSLNLVKGSKDWNRYRKRAQEDLYWLNAKVLNHERIIPMTERAHLGMCRFAERKTGIPDIDECRVQLIHVSRFWGKSTCITKGRTIQRIIQDRDWAAGIANESGRMAEAFLASIKTEFESNEFLQALFPEIIPDFKNTTWKMDRIIVNRTRPNPVSPSVLAIGVGGNVTGVHMNEWIIDDLLSRDVAENARTGSFSEIEKLNRWVHGLEYLLTRAKKDPITFIGTPWWPGDTYDYIQDVYGRKEKERVFNWKLRLSNGDVQYIKLVRKGDLAIFRFPAIQDGFIVEPRIYDEQMLESLQADNPAFYSAQVLLNPTEGDETAFHPEWLKTFDWDNQAQIRFRNNDGRIQFERVRDMACVMSIDPAISQRSQAARSAINVTGSNGKAIFLLESWAERCPPTVLANQIIDFYKKYKPVRIIIEAVAYQMALAEILVILAREQRLGNLPIFEYRSGADKKGKMRIVGLQPYFKRGFFYYHPASQKLFLEEYTNFSPVIGNRTVDILDSLAFQKESWEALGFLGDSEANAEHEKHHRDAERERAQRIRERFSLGRNRATREWNEPRGYS